MKNTFECAAPTDRFGRRYTLGDIVAKAEAKRGHPGGINLRSVIEIDNGKVYLNGVTPVPLRMPERCIIMTGLVPAEVAAEFGV